MLIQNKNKNNFNYKLKQYVNQNVDTTSNYENILFAHEIASFGLISNFNSFNDLLRNKLVNYFCPAFILNTVYNTIEWPDNSRNIFLELLYYYKYPKGIGLLQSIDFYCKDYESYQKKLAEKYFI